MTSKMRWVLAFDAGCGTCRRLSQRIERACAGKLETRPLRSAEVAGWQAEALGQDAPDAPTLFRVEGAPDAAGAVRAWPGRAMIVPLVRHLGLRSSLAVVHALGSLRDEIAADAPEPVGLVSRKRFLQFGAGAAIAGALVVRGAMPAYASTSVRRWVDANADRLPTTYAALVRYPVDYRRAILGRLTPAQRSALWVEHVQRYRAAHPGLTPVQRRVVDDVLTTVRRTSLFADEERPTGPVPALRSLRDRAEGALGADETRALIATFGPAEDAPRTSGVHPDAPACGCVTASDYCWGTCVYRAQGCIIQNPGCGEFYIYECNGCCDGAC